MEQGSLSELYLTRSVTKHIRKINKDILVGSAVGNDFSAVRTSNKDIVVSSEGISEDPYLAWTKACNNVYASGGTPVSARIILLIPADEEENYLKSCMTVLNDLAYKQGIQIAGGHTQCSVAFTIPSICVCITGVTDRIFETKKNDNEIDIVMTKYTGIAGTNIIVDNKKEELTTRYARSYVESAYFDNESYSIKSDAEIARKFAIDNGMSFLYMHDVSSSGLYGALWQLGVKLKSGFMIHHDRIPIRQETIEVSEFFDINPYMLEGTGSLLVATCDGEGLVKEYLQNGINASCIGKLQAKNERVIRIPLDYNTRYEMRYLSPPKGEELQSKMRR